MKTTTKEPVNGTEVAQRLLSPPTVPPVNLVRLQGESIEIMRRAKAIVITNDADESAAVEFLVNLKKKTEEVEEQYKATTQPFNQFLTRVRNMFAPIRESLSNPDDKLNPGAAQIAKAKVIEYREVKEKHRQEEEAKRLREYEEQQRKVREEAEKAERERERLAAEERRIREERERAEAALKEHNNKAARAALAEAKAKEEEAARLKAENDKKIERANVIVAPPPMILPADNTTRSSSGSASLKQEWDFEVVDVTLVPAEYKKVDEALIGKVVRAGMRNIPGVRIFAKKNLAVSA